MLFDDPYAMILTLTDCSFGVGRNVANVRSSITLILEPVSSIIVRWAFSTLSLVCGNFASGLASLSVYSVYVLEVFVGLHVIDVLIAAFSRSMSGCVRVLDSHCHCFCSTSRND